VVTDALEYELFDFGRGHASDAANFVLPLLQDGMRYIVPVAHATLVGVRGAHAVASIIEDATGQNGRRASELGPTTHCVFSELGLHGLEQLPLKDRLMSTGMDRAAIGDLANVKAVLDAGQDGHFQFADLSAVVRKIRIDFNVEIAFDMPMSMVKEKAWSDEKSRPFQLATVMYPACPEEGLPALEGRLLYIKSCRLPEMTIDVRGHAFEDEEFPADTTADQFFNESKFESYRKLGEFIGDRAMKMEEKALITFREDIATAP
jgi:hypothetical protein